MPYKIIYGDIIKQDVECIINPWNQNIPYFPLVPHGLSGYLKKNGARDAFKELKKYGYMKVGEAVITSAGELNFKYIIHVAGIKFWGLVCR